MGVYSKVAPFTPKHNSSVNSCHISEVGQPMQWPQDSRVLHVTQSKQDWIDHIHHKQQVGLGTAGWPQSDTSEGELTCFIMSATPLFGIRHGTNLLGHDVVFPCLLAVRGPNPDHDYMMVPVLFWATICPRRKAPMGADRSKTLPPNPLL